jgi:1,4-alpha-glucan branching enzyme
MGNEFGHPEWIDFPREGNGFSHHYARRQWSLAEQDHLHYSSLLAFDRAMLELDAGHHLLSEPHAELLWIHEEMRVLVFRRGRFVFAFNFHATASYTDLAVIVPEPSDYSEILGTDASDFGGQGRTDPTVRHIWEPTSSLSYPHQVRLYLPARTALVLQPAGI